MPFMACLPQLPENILESCMCSQYLGVIVICLGND